MLRTGRTLGRGPGVMPVCKYASIALKWPGACTSDAAWTRQTLGSTVQPRAGSRLPTRWGNTIEQRGSVFVAEDISIHVLHLKGRYVT
jgi:hypothetical protein